MPLDLSLPVLSAPPNAAGGSAVAEDDTFGTRLEHLDWIDEFVASIRSYVRVRADDGVLIKMPSEVFPLSRSGVGLLERALAGEPIRQIALAVEVLDHPERIREIHVFFCDVRDLLGFGRQPPPSFDRREGCPEPHRTSSIPGARLDSRSPPPLPSVPSGPGPAFAAAIRPATFPWLSSLRRAVQLTPAWRPFNPSIKSSRLID